MTKTTKLIHYKVATIFALMFCISSCVSGPESPGQTLAQKLNADSYESSNAVMGVPVLTRKKIQRKVFGKLTCGEGLSNRPVSHATVSLNDGNTIVASASSESDGAYTILAFIFVEKSYQIKASSACGTSTKEISLKEDSNFDLILRN